VRLSSPPTASFAQQAGAATHAIAALSNKQSGAVDAVIACVGPRGFQSLFVAPTRLVVTLSFTPSQRVRQALLIAMIDLASALVTTSEVERLAAGAATARDPLGRRHDLRELAERFPRSPVTRAALLHACKDNNEQVRTAAAFAAGKDGLPTLRALILDTAAAEHTRGKAFHAYAELVSAAEWRTLILKLATASDAWSAALALDASDALSPGPAVSVLVTLFRHADDAVLRRAVHKLPRYATEIATLEPALIACLGWVAADVAADLAYFLGEAGTRAAVPALSLALKNAKTGQERRAIKDAQAKLLDRHALESGALSFAEDARGQVSKG
jgi:hypothetical protein